MMLAPVVPEWVVVILVAVPNFAIGVVILVFRKRIRMFIKSLIPRMSEDAEFWISRVIILGGFLLMTMPTLLVYATISSAIEK